jgi:hypothetical protein
LLYPTLLAVSLVFSVKRIIFHLLSLPLSLPGPLTLLFTAVPLVLDAGLRSEQAAAVGTLNLMAHGFPPGKTINLLRHSYVGRIRIRFKVNGRVTPGKKEENKRWLTILRLSWGTF